MLKYTKENEMAGRRYYRTNNNSKNKALALDPVAMKISIADLSLSESTAALLEKNNIKNAAELCIRTEKDMYKIQTLNKRVLTEISGALKKHGLAFKPLDAPTKVQNTRSNVGTKKNTNATVDEMPKAERRQPKARSEVQVRQPRVRSERVKATKVDESILTMYPAGKVDFLTSNTNQTKPARVERAKRIKEPIITSPLPVEEWRKIQRGNKWGFYDGMKTVINPTYDEVFHFKEGLACVELNEKCGYIDSENNVVIPIEYETAFSFSENLAVVIVGGKCGYINHENELVVPCVYDAASPFEGGVARVKQAGRWGFLSPDGNIRWK